MPKSISDTEPWIRRFQPAEDAATRLVCFPHAGGSASYFFPVARTLAPKLDVLAVQYPGRQDRRAEPGIDNVPGLVSACVENLLPWLDKPVVLFGHSLGATVAFEVARVLTGQGRPPLALVVTGRRAPSRHFPEENYLSSDDRLIEIVRELSGDEDPVSGNEEILRMSLPSIRNDFKAAETYRYEPGEPLPCPIHAMSGTADPKAPVEDVRAWGEHTSGHFEMKTFPGGHFFLNVHGAAVNEEISRVASSTLRSA
ncbi:thioesterase II family protein [Amycolatopsis azurea]|uniref:thioesterase II family protein n=1 Tax=Amycolatopsis TaxID=1813 RepID=UPI000C77C07C|nr:alpha/beta fold hydrolase [Amycolatopsis sp. BJA-103]AUI64329.1 thioesterase [Amycolatopsis sp. BJA-103]PNE13410.1 thioesterase [Amycolatopsis sp. BJA-103]